MTRIGTTVTKTVVHSHRQKKEGAGDKVPGFTAEFNKVPNYCTKPLLPPLGGAYTHWFQNWYTEITTYMTSSATPVGLRTRGYFWQGNQLGVRESR